MVLVAFFTHKASKTKVHFFKIIVPKYKLWEMDFVKNEILDFFFIILIC